MTAEDAASGASGRNAPMDRGLGSASHEAMEPDHLPPVPPDGVPDPLPPDSTADALPPGHGRLGEIPPDSTNDPVPPNAQAPAVPPDARA